MNENELKIIRALTGEITEDDLRYVESYISEHMVLFAPSVGFCQYAIRPRHTHPGYSFIIYFSNDQHNIPISIEIKPNHYFAAAFSPQVEHEEPIGDSFVRYIAVCIDKNYFEEQIKAYDVTNIDSYCWWQFLVHKDIMFLLKAFMEEYQNNSKGKKQILESLALLITHQLIRGLNCVKVDTDELVQRTEIESAINYMEQNFSKRITNAYLAQLINLSESYFIHLFKKETGHSPMEYLMKIRIEKAKKLLKDNTHSVTDVSIACGFNTPSYFATCFLKHCLITPSEYQNNYL